MNNRHIKAILFDSGNVLNYPKTGDWILPPVFYNIVKQGVFKSIDEIILNNAFTKGFEYLGSNHFIQNEIEEFDLFIKFHNVFFNDYLKLNLTQANIEEITRDTVYNDKKYIFYDDVYEIITKLSKDYKIGLVSDTWPSLERVYRNIGLRKYFSTFVISAKLGVRKPNRLMFETALQELNIKPEEAIFVDDSIENIIGAQKLGINPILMIRSEQNSLQKIEDSNKLGIKYINDLTEINKYID